MRKLFISFLITLGFLASPNLWADQVGDGATKLSDTDAGNAKLHQILTSICSTNGTTTSSTIKTSVSKTDATGYVEPGTVFFVDMNSHWKGLYSSDADGYNPYDEINEGVKDVIRVKEDSKQTTSTGTFYTHQAEDVNKFFFIVRRDSRKVNQSGYSTDYGKLAFSWYDEWSYVINTSNGYDDLLPSLAELSDGAPFFSPHSCATSLENNHYITLNAKDDYESKGHYFTAYFYLPKHINTSDSPTTATEVIGYEDVYTGATYCVNSSKPSLSLSSWYAVSDAGDELYVKDNNGNYIPFKTSEYAGMYYKEGGNFFTSYTEITVYTKSNQEITKTVTVPAGNTPYVFFYRIKLGEIGLADDAAIADNIVSTLTPPATTPSDKDMKCYYKVNLDWGTSFDRYRSDLTATSYSTMKEHFIIQRSFDKTNWVTVGTLDVSGNDENGNEKMKYEKYKTFTDENLPDFDETTKKIGYTVFYQIISEVQKEDGTVMSTTKSDDITVNIPGTTPIKLTLEAGGTSNYQPGSMNGEEYTDGENNFVNKLTAGKSVYEGTVNLAAGVKLELVRTTCDEYGNETKTVINPTPAICTETTTLEQLVAMIGTVSDDVTTDAGDKYDAQYQLVLTYTDNTTTESNIVKILNSKVSNTSVSVHRSGTPDKETCATTELFRNEVKFMPQMSAVPGAGYDVYCNGELVLTLNDNTNNSDFTGDNGTKYTVDADGYITMTFFAEHNPIAVGEDADNVTSANFHYAVAHFDAAGNTYGSAAVASDYHGAKDELVVNINNSTSTLGKHYDLVFIRPVVNWTLNKAADDVKSPIRYDIYMKMGQAEFEENGTPSSGRTGNVKGWEGDNFGKYILRGSVKYGDGSTFADEIFYARKKQETGTWVNPIANDEIRPVSYYVKAVYSNDAVVKQNVKEKNSDVFAVKASAGGIFTAIDDVAAEGVSVEANDGVITVTGAIGTIVVYSATGQAVATAQGDGGVTTIDASNLNGVYIVKAKNMISTRILIK